MPPNLETQGKLDLKKSQSLTPLRAVDQAHKELNQMYLLLEDPTAIADAHSALAKTLRQGFPKEIVRDIGYPGGTSRGAVVQTDGAYWFFTADHDRSNRPNPKQWNWFGRVKDGGFLHISVEINTPYSGRNDRIAGFFAKNVETGNVYLFHSGRIGGGKKGIGKFEFLAETNLPLEPVADSNGDIREGILVMPVSGPDAHVGAVSFINTVADFKTFVTAGGAESTQFKLKVNAYRDYYDEASGRRKGKRSGLIDYVSRHGDIVRELFEWRKARLGEHDGRLVKNVLVDLAVEQGGRLTEVYEVKTSTSRTDLYAAIGQLMVHGGGDGCAGFIVYPDALPVPSDIVSAFSRLGIQPLTVRVSKSKVRVVG